MFITYVRSRIKGHSYLSEAKLEDFIWENVCSIRRNNRLETTQKETQELSDQKKSQTEKMKRSIQRDPMPTVIKMSTVEYNEVNWILSSGWNYDD